MARLPWTTHLLATAAVLAWLVVPPLHTYGYDPHARWEIGPWMSPGWYAAPLPLAVPLAGLEAWAATAGRRWVARLAAATSSGLYAVVVALPVSLRFFGSRDPVERGQVEMAAHSLPVALAVQVALLVGAVLVLRRLGGARRR